jgi:hypothetical protein
MKVKIPAALRYIMGVADAMPELRAPAAHVTSFCHKNTLQPPSPQVFKQIYYQLAANFRNLAGSASYPS